MRTGIVLQTIPRTKEDQKNIEEQPMLPVDGNPPAISARVLSRLHSSPSSEVYTTTLLSDQSTVVVVKRTKITGPNDMKRFDKELELLRACENEGIIRPLGVLLCPPTYALILPLYEHGTLFSVLHSSHRSLTTAAQLGLAADAAAALEHLHERGILHRDVKSDNIFVSANGGAVLADFNASEWQSQEGLA